MKLFDGWRLEVTLICNKLINDLKIFKDNLGKSKGSDKIYYLRAKSV